MLLRQRYCIVVFLVVIVLASLVAGDYVLEVEVLRYENQRSVRNDGFQCSAGGTSPCNNHFTFCLRPSHYPTTIPAGAIDVRAECPLGSYATSNITGDDLTFTVGEDLNGGVPNPLIFTGIRWPGSVQLLIRINDLDTQNVSRVVQDFNVPAEIVTGDEKYTDTVRNFVMAKFIRLSFLVWCGVGSFGDCSCVPQNDELGHFNCDSEGNVQCLEGYRNTSAKCTECIPADGCSTVGGYCNTPGDCTCHVNYSGPTCSVDEDPCGNSKPCRNGATCHNLGPDAFECQCLEGYEGSDCGRSTDECSPNPCQNGASCEDRHLGYTCLCTDGFDDRNCSTEINECIPQPCQNGASCRDNIGDFECTCPEGITGKACQYIDFCSANPCLNKAPCENIEGSYTCLCSNGFRGRNCETAELSLEGIIGGVVGASAVLLLVVFILILGCVYLQAWGRRSTKTSDRNDAAAFGGELAELVNPIYEVATIPHRSLAVSQPVSTLDSVVHKFDNPIYAQGPKQVNEDPPPTPEKNYARLRSNSSTTEEKHEEGVYYSSTPQEKHEEGVYYSTIAEDPDYELSKHDYESLDKGMHKIGRRDENGYDCVAGSEKGTLRKGSKDEHGYDLVAGGSPEKEELSLQLPDPYDDIVVQPRKTSRPQYEAIEDVKLSARKQLSFSTASDEGFVRSPFENTLQSAESLVAPWETLANSMTTTAEYNSNMQISELDL